MQRTLSGAGTHRCAWNDRVVPEPVPAPPRVWRTPEELVAIGFERSPVVLMNEAHNLFLRSVASRRVGARVLPTAHAARVRNLAMEALIAHLVPTINATRVLPAVEDGYLAQPEMRDLIDVALELGWDLHAYEISSMPDELRGRGVEAANWRDDQHARNLLAIRARLGDETPLLVWCGNSHLAKVGMGGLQPMGLRLTELSDLDPFSIDQTQGVVFEEGRVPYAARWVSAYEGELAARGGAAGFLIEDAPAGWVKAGADAYVLLLENRLT
jgi:hypothetical protein